MSGQLALVMGAEMVEPAAVWEALSMDARARVTVRLAVLLARLIAEERDER